MEVTRHAIFLFPHHLVGDARLFLASDKRLASEYLVTGFYKRHNRPVTLCRYLRERVRDNGATPER